MKLLLHICIFIFWLISFASADELGKIDFPTSGTPEAQKHFLTGVKWLHSFEYENARAAFQEAQKMQPDFAMAYWGEAMTYNHPLWMEVDVDAATAVLKRLGETPDLRLASAPTEREKDYLRAVEVLYTGSGEKKERDDAYAQAMLRLTGKYPKDLEAAAFYSLALLGTCQYERDFPIYMKAAAVAEEILQKNPAHPGAVHYLIHSYDDPIHAPLGLRPARVYAKIAPAAPHALHMPSHIFLALGMWDDVIASNIDSWEASKQKSYHALYWLMYGYLQKGNHREARKLLKIMEKDHADLNSERTGWHLAAMRATYIVETKDLNGDAVAIRLQPWEADLAVQSSGLFVNGWSALENRDLSRANENLVAMRELREKSKSWSGGKGAHHGQRGMDPNEIQIAQIMEKQLEAKIQIAEGKIDQGLSLLKETIEIEDQLSFEFGPPLPVKPAHELYAEELLRAGKSQEAAKEFQQALKKAPGRLHSTQGLKVAVNAGRQGSPR